MNEIGKAEWPDGRYTEEERLICALSRELRDGETAAVGNQSPVPAAAVMLAKATHASSARLLILGDARNWPFESTSEFFAHIQRGDVDVFFLGGAQIDPYGSINLHAIGDIAKPKVRLPGGAGSAMAYYRCKRVYLVKTDHHPRSFPEALDFATSHASPGYREPGFGVLAGVFTPIAVLRPDGEDGKLRLSRTAPGYSAADVQSRTGFAISAGEDEVPVLEPPTEAELLALRTIVRRHMATVYPEFTRGGIRHG